MSEADRHRLREIFGQDANLYDRCRPGYPDALFADLTTIAGLRPGARVLEIGPGTGQATAPLARLGSRVTAVEISPAMAAVARRRLAGWADVEVVVGAFEEWPLPTMPFDLVLSATAFHWVDPGVRVRKSAQALRPDGTLAVVSTHHIRGGTQHFFEEVQPCYERFDPDTPPGLTLVSSEDIPQEAGEFDDSGEFGSVDFRCLEWDATYSTSGYLNLLATYSNHRALPAPARTGLFRCIGALIEQRYNGHITKRYLTQLATAQRREAAAGL